MKVNKSALVVTLLSLVTFLQLPQATFALEILVDDQGVVSFYDDGVLGDSTEANPIRIEKPAIKKATTNENKRVEIKAKKDLVEVRVKDEDDSKEDQKPSTTDVMEAKRLRAQFNTKRLPEKITEKSEAEAEETKKNKELKVKLTEAETEYRKELEQKRRENEDALEVKSQLDLAGEQELELQNNAIRAKLRGADFSYNPETNVVTLTTPSGKEHELKHLPDQALERINAVITVENSDPAAADVQIETTETGTLYRTTAVKRKKLFGLFNRDIQTEVVLDDETGKVATIEQKSPGIFGQLLDAFTR